MLCVLAAAIPAPAQQLKGGIKGKGFGWVWGKDDEVGALNAILAPERVKQALASVKTGRVFDLGVPLDQHSYKWPGHSATAIMSYRTPENVRRMGDVAGWKGVDALPGMFPITSKELKGALAAQKVDVEPGDIVLVRTGTLRYWGKNGSDHAKIAEHDSAGITLEAAKWLVEEKGAVMIGADTSGIEVGRDPSLPGAVNAVHEYLLVEQGVHILEFHNLEQLAANRTYRFTYVAMTNRLLGAVAGTAMRPIAIE